MLCRFKICRDCYLDAQKETGNCPGCKEQYRVGEEYDDSQDYNSGTLQLPGPDGKRDNMSVMKRNQTGEFDHNRWLFETKGTYGVGNAFYPPDDYGDGGGDGFHGGPLESDDKPWKPLSRKLPIAAAIISPYRLIMNISLPLSLSVLLQVYLDMFNLI